ncbi:hypothetical protein LUZ60_004906 [Juncus effusus]|nr:hypothetical protein LUZ60_004906 [Juncus effusus]
MMRHDFSSLTKSLNYPNWSLPVPRAGTRNEHEHEQVFSHPFLSSSVLLHRFSSPCNTISVFFFLTSFLLLLLLRVILILNYPKMSRNSGSKAPPTTQNRRLSTTTNSNPFDFDSDSEIESNRRTSSQSPYAFSAATNNRSQYKNDFRDSGGIQKQSTQELENYAVYKSEETTEAVQRSLRIAEEMRDGASKTLVQLHQQGQQIERTHMMAVDIDQDLSRGEKLLGSLGGIFSRKWKPQKNRPIQGPMLTRDDSFIRKGSHLEQRQRLGLTAPVKQSNPRNFTTEPTSVFEKVEFEKKKQDDSLDDLSNILGELKHMARDMGSEIERQTVALGHTENDIDELNFRVRGANVRTRKLLGK